MAHVSDLISKDIEQYLLSHEKKSLLRFITCGSVDDGKSTLIGRLLYESKMLFEDQLAALEADSKKVGTRDGEIDYALLLDGLAAEREQGITIDVAYRFFSTDLRKFIVADTPGHEQYTRNMVTGASTADLAIILIDARKGVLVQTRRHSYLVNLIGIRHIVLAINKMDLVNYSKEVFDKIEADYREFARQIGLPDIHVIPISGVKGDNIVDSSANTPWYQGPTLMRFLETVQIDEEYLQKQPFRLPVQWVNRPNLDFRGFTGTIASGVIQSGQRIRVMPSGRESTVTRIVTAGGDLDLAVANQSITITLADEVDISRGDVICTLEQPSQVADIIEASIVWMTDQPLTRGRPYFLKIGPKLVTATITKLEYRINVNTLERLPAERFDLNEIGVCRLELDRPVSLDAYSSNRETGGFILIDKLTNNTVGAGMVREGHLKASSLDWQTMECNRETRALIKAQRPCILSVQGSDVQHLHDVSQLIERKLHSENRHTMLIDTRTVHVSLDQVLSLLLDAGLIVVLTGAECPPSIPPQDVLRVVVDKSETALQSTERIVHELMNFFHLGSEQDDYMI